MKRLLLACEFIFYSKSKAYNLWLLHFFFKVLNVTRTITIVEFYEIYGKKPSINSYIKIFKSDSNVNVKIINMTLWPWSSKWIIFTRRWHLSMKR